MTYCLHPVFVSAATTTTDSMRAAGRGFLTITAAKAYFIVTSYFVQLILPRILGSAELFGLYASAMNPVSILNNVLVAATLQSVSKLVSEDETRAPATLRNGLKMQGVIGSALAAWVYVTSPWVAEHVLLDPKLTTLFRITSISVFSYSLYAVFVGWLNGHRNFQQQARLDMTFSTLRTGGILIAATLGFGAVGAISGFSVAAAMILLVAAITVRRRPGQTIPLEIKPWLHLLGPMWLYQGAINGVLQVDLMVLKRTIAELGIATGMPPDAAANLASEYSAYYRAAQTFAFVPYQLMISMVFVVFPTVSHAVAMGDMEKARNTLRGALRASLLALLGISAPIAGAADGVMRIAFPRDYMVAAPALSILVFGMVGFALFVVASTALTGTGRPWLAAAIAWIVFAITVSANRWFLLHTGIRIDSLVAAATATSISTGIAVVLIGSVLFITLGAFLPILSLIRGLIATGFAFGASHFIPHPSALTALLSLIVGFVVYVATLFLIREVRAEEIQRLLHIARSR